LLPGFLTELDGVLFLELLGFLGVTPVESCPELPVGFKKNANVRVLFQKLKFKNNLNYFTLVFSIPSKSFC
jgi:hypothetical protein